MSSRVIRLKRLDDVEFFGVSQVELRDDVAACWLDGDIASLRMGDGLFQTGFDTFKCLIVAADRKLTHLEGMC
jgi:hypothetical protein